MDNYEKYRNSKIIRSAEVEMKKCKHPYVGTEHLLLSLLKLDEISIICNKYDLTYDSFKTSLLKIVGKSSMETSFILHTPLLKMIVLDSVEETDGVLNAKKLFISLLENGDGIAVRILDNMGINLDKLYDELKKDDNLKVDFGLNLNDIVDLNDVVTGRDKELDLVIETLLRKNKSNPILVGPAGVGKTAIVFELARRIKKGLVPKNLKNKQVISLEMCELLAGTKYRGEFEEKIKRILDICKENKDIILFIDEVHTIVNAGGSEGAIDAANILKPYLSNGSISVIGATTIYEYNKFIKKDKALDRRFQMVSVKEPSVLDTIEILNKSKKIYEKFYGIKISKANIKDIVINADKFIKNKYNPDKSFEILDLICSRMILKEQYFINHNNIKHIFEDITDFGVNEKFNYNLIKEKFNERIIGQNNVIEKIVENLKNKNNKSISMLFYGNTGVGKTESVKILSELINYKLIRLDMSEFNNEMSISRLIGVDNGYRGCDEGYILESVRLNPRSIILLDDIEKGSKKIINLFLNAIDEGFMKDSKGEIIDFSNTIFIFTCGICNNSNIGFAEEKNVNKSNFFASDFISRIDDIIYFNNISKEMIESFLEKKQLKFLLNAVLNTCDFKKYGFRAIKKYIKNYNIKQIS